MNTQMYLALAIILLIASCKALDEPHGDEEGCITDWECVQECLAKLPENRSEAECDI